MTTRIHGSDVAATVESVRRSQENERAKILTEVISKVDRELKTYFEIPDPKARDIKIASIRSFIQGFTR